MDDIYQGTTRAGLKEAVSFRSVRVTLSFLTNRDALAAPDAGAVLGAQAAAEADTFLHTWKTFGDCE